MWLIVMAHCLDAHAGSFSAQQVCKPIKKRFHKPVVKAMTHTDMHKITLAASSSK